MTDEEKYFTTIKDGNLVVKTLSQSGDIINDRPKDKYFTALINTDNGKQLVVKTINMGGGGGDIDEAKIIIKTATMPEPSAANLGYVYIYTGTNTATYKHGYIYENKVTTEYSGSITFSPSTISISEDNYAAFLNAGTSYISNPSSITHGTMTYHAVSAIWRWVGYDADNNEVGARQIYQSDYEDYGFVFTGTFSDGDVLTFTTSITENSTYDFVRIDVQPGGGSVIIVPSLPLEGDSRYLYGVLMDDLTRDNYGIVQFFTWYENEWYAAGAYSIDIDPSTLVYKENFQYNSSTGVLNIIME